jgi:hypothetical protein
MIRRIFQSLALMVVGLSLAASAGASAGCVHCNEYPPGTKISKSGAVVPTFQGKPAKGGAETRPSS